VLNFRVDAMAKRSSHKTSEFKECRELPFLGPEECLSIREFVHAQREHWRAQSAVAPFFTFGAATYLDSQYDSSPRMYHFRAQRLNRVLRAGLPGLYERLLEKVKEGLETDQAYYPYRLALPGFHVFLAHKAFELPVCSVHVDLPFDHLRWSESEQVDTSRAISFTLPISLPKTGAGLNIWDMHKDEFQRLKKDQIEPALKGRALGLHRYTPGTMVIHSGFLVHQIAPFAMTAPDDERITLQGHAVYSAHGWQVYW
jgi:hypothetical protein